MREEKIKQLYRIREQKKELEKQEKTLANEVKTSLTGVNYFNGFKVEVKTVERKKVNPEKLRQKQPILYRKTLELIPQINETKLNAELETRAYNPEIIAECIEITSSYKQVVIKPHFTGTEEQ